MNLNTKKYNNFYEFYIKINLYEFQLLGFCFVIEKTKVSLIYTGYMSC